MCLTLYAHYTSRRHDSRPFSLLNPTGNQAVRRANTVSNPFADPPPLYCQFPCVTEPIDYHLQCPWHRGCCRLEEESWCEAPSRCPNAVVSHFHPNVRWEDRDRAELPFRRFFAEQNWFVSLRGDLFQAASVLWETNQKILDLVSDIAEARRSASGRDRDPSGYSSLRRALQAAERQFESDAYFLGQLARVWDLQHERGRCPVRPGRRIVAEASGGGFEQRHPRADGRRTVPRNEVPWPDWISVGDEGVPSVASLRAAERGEALAPGEFGRHYPPRPGDDASAYPGLDSEADYVEFRVPDYHVSDSHRSPSTAARVVEARDEVDFSPRTKPTTLEHRHRVPSFHRRPLLSTSTADQSASARTTASRTANMNTGTEQPAAAMPVEPHRDRQLRQGRRPSDMADSFNYRPRI